jgi:hypothetical protein
MMCWASASKVNCCKFKHLSHSRPVADFFLQLAAVALPGKLVVLRMSASRFKMGRPVAKRKGAEAWE